MDVKTIVIIILLLLFSGKVKKTVRNILLWVSFILLSIYSLAVVTFIVKKVNNNK